MRGQTRQEERKGATKQKLFKFNIIYLFIISGVAGYIEFWINQPYRFGSHNNYTFVFFYFFFIFLLLIQIHLIFDFVVVIIASVAVVVTISP